MLNIACVVVFYKPNEMYIKNLQSYASSMGKVYIIDNSATNNSNLLVNLPNVKYVANLTNLGIAKALNIGCTLALSDGYDYVMTMDQDSTWDKNQLSKFLSFVENNSSSSVCSFAPTFDECISNSVLGDIKEKFKKLFYRSKLENQSKVVEEKFVITSGNILSLSAWNKVGGFYEPFFIDEVDHEFCYRLQKQNLKILKFLDVKLDHCIGEHKRQFYPGDTHRGNRIYYMLRNGLYVKKLHPDYYFRLGYPKKLRHLVLGVILNLRFYKIPYLLHAYTDFRADKLGKYEDLHS